MERFSGGLITMSIRPTARKKNRRGGKKKKEGGDYDLNEILLGVALAEMRSVQVRLPFEFYRVRESFKRL